jgi:hypothetical protein
MKNKLIRFEDKLNSRLVILCGWNICDIKMFEAFAS